MEKYVQVNETTLVDRESLPFYVENNFTPLFDVSNQITQKIESINSMVATVIQNKTKKIDSLQTEEEKQQWYTETLRDLTIINQALFGVMMVVNEKVTE